MITGIVTAAREAVVPIEVRGAANHFRVVDAVLDTGFSGCLLLSIETIAFLQLPLAGSGKALLADGQTVAFDVYDGIVLWDETPRRIEIIATEGDALLGMELLEGFRIRLDVIAQGQIAIEALSNES